MEKDKIRQPHVAGQFYPASAKMLREQINAFIDREANPREAIACMLPHAGYIYSGPVAVKTVSRIKLKKRIVLLGPNHTGLGEPFSIATEGLWRTPLGDVAIDSILAQEILGRCRHLKADNLAHLNEHSLEVELPILQYFRNDLEIVPIAFLCDDLLALKEIGREIASSVQELKIRDNVLLVASSDMTHYRPQREAQEKDRQAIAAILELDPDELMRRVKAMDISMCGYAPVIAMLSAALALGAKKGELINYQTSGDVTGDTSSVVGYAGIIIS